MKNEKFLSIKIRFQIINYDKPIWDSVDIKNLEYLDDCLFKTFNNLITKMKLNIQENMKNNLIKNKEFQIRCLEGDINKLENGELLEL